MSPVSPEPSHAEPSSKTCVCQLCSCGCHRCPHLLTKPYERNEEPCTLSEYKEKYPLYPNTLPRDPIKPKAEYEIEKTPMEGTSMTKRDYIAHEVLPPKFKEPEKHVKSDEAMDLTSIYKRDYNPYPICLVPPCLPRQETEISSDKMNTKSTYTDDYLPWKEPRTEMIRPDHGYHPSEAKFDHRTVVQDEYYFRGPVATQSFKPRYLPKKSKVPLENMTDYRVNYVVRPLEKRYVHQYEKFKPSDAPFDGLTTNKVAYKGLAGEPAKLIKPHQPKLLHDPFFTLTEFQEKYKPWPQPPLFTKEPVQYVPPVEKMDLHTTTQLHYRQKDGKPAKACLPVTQQKMSTEPFDSSSTMKEDYKPWVCKRVEPITHAPELKFSDKPMDCLTTFRSHYLPQPLTLTKSYKPPWPGPRPHIPLGAKTTYATSYTPKGFVKCLASFKSPPGYNFEGINADGHKFYVPASEEGCLQGCQ
ncbi:stabilizer of axonemal microtubules 1 isoform X5 [Coturnix japonica]|uniref:Stabilizer of axonemal microtubules 1 n=1 Tax=Coturnix japonica TaxID=93934 RepID=A0A8C2TAC0_COTJA|nr:stabilizer of axonemal microtubules 1 isoform X5 [Coturnix japonica]